jgi:hypothetical protein
MAPSLYDQDFYAWANEQAALLRAGNLSAADIENIAEEIESMGRGEKRELMSRLTVLLLHLLKWKFQSGFRSKSWIRTIKEQRIALIHHLIDNPSLKSKCSEVVKNAYSVALIGAIDETNLPEEVFPTECPWLFDQIMDATFWPE